MKGYSKNQALRLVHFMNFFARKYILA